jgi:hypothetical protein
MLSYAFSIDMNCVGDIASKYGEGFAKILNF